MELRNRTVRSATNERLSEPDGQLSRAWAEATIELAKHEVGLIMTGHMTVDRTQRADPGQPVIDDLTNQNILAKTAEEVHRCGGKLVGQLSHSGLKADAAVNRCPPKRPKDFGLEELDRLVDQFVRSAQICQQCGLDGVQVHCAHGYLLSNFLNSEENDRTDNYGGTLENRFELPRRILSAIRRSCGPNFALLVKMNCNGGADFGELMKYFQEAGVDAIEISGLDFNARAGQKKPFYLEKIKVAAERVTVPLILVGGVFSKAAAEAVLSAGIPFVAFSRALICEPDFIEQMKTERCEESRCFACNSCYTVHKSRYVRCVQHAQKVEQLEKTFG